MKKLFKNWSILELFLLTCCPIVVLVVGIIFKSDALTIITSIGGIVCGMLLAKGFAMGQFFGALIAILYSIVSFKNGFYGEMLIYLLIALPMYIWGVIEWLRHKNKETKSVQINSISIKEWVIVGICSVLVFIGSYFLLKALNTNELIVSTMSFNFSILARYLLARRCKYGFASYIIYDLILIVLWGIPIIQGDLTLLVMLVNPIVNLVNDSYGFINWTKLQRKQKNGQSEQ